MDFVVQAWGQAQPLLVISLLISLGCALLCGFIAARRKLPWGYWAILGFAFGPFALPFVFISKPKIRSVTKSETA